MQDLLLLGRYLTGRRFNLPNPEPNPPKKNALWHLECITVDDVNSALPLRTLNCGNYGIYSLIIRLSDSSVQISEAQDLEQKVLNPLQP